jgi:GDP-L-fucose synthase
MTIDRQASVYVAGHRGMVGSAIMRRLEALGFTDIITRTHSDLDLREQADVRTFFAKAKPRYVFLAAARVGGIHANNTYRADFIRENLEVQTNVIDSAYRSGTDKLLFLGSSCIYPREAPQPMREEYFLTGRLEPTNEPYAIAKIAGIKMCESYRYQYGFNAISIMPTNLYGPGDNFDLENSHMLPALIRKFHEAKSVNAPSVDVWGTGTPQRELMHVDDMADACLFLMDHYDDEGIVNAGLGSDATIKEIAETVGRVTGYTGRIEFDTTRPDGMRRKLLDVTKINGLGWQAKTNLEDGIRSTYRWYLETHSSAPGAV